MPHISDFKCHVGATQALSLCLCIYPHVLYSSLLVGTLLASLLSDFVEILF